MERERMTPRMELLGPHGSTKTFGERPIRFGSLPECEVQIAAEPAASLAVLLRLDERWILVEAADSAELRVNGVRVFQAPVSDGDEIQVRGVPITIRIDRNPSQRPSPAPTIDHEAERATKQFPGLAKIGVVLCKTLHRGASGALFKARWSRQPQAPVVVKILSSHLVGDEAAMFRFCRGVTAAGDLRNPHLMRLYRAGKSGDGWYLIGEYANRGSLRDQLQITPPLSPRTRARLAVKIGLEIGSALEFIADAGLVHRAVAPSAILFDERGTAKLGDFALVRSEDVATMQRFTMAGDAVAKHAYLPPEQVLGATNLDVRADVYSLGAAMYFAATGKPPFEGKTLVELIDAVCRRKPIPPSALNPDVSTALDQVVLKALAKEPAARFATPGEFRIAVAALAKS